MALVFQVQCGGESLWLVLEEADSGVYGAGCQVKLVIYVPKNLWLML